MERRVVNSVTEAIKKVVCVFLFLTDRTHQRGEVILEEARHMVHWLRLIQDLDNPLSSWTSLRHTLSLIYIQMQF